MENKMPWTQTLAIMGEILVATGAMIGFIIWLDGKHEKALEQSDARWQQMFAHMSGRIDNIKDGLPSKTTLGKN